MSFEWGDYFIALQELANEPGPESETEPEPTRYCAICKVQKSMHQFPSKTQFHKCGICIACGRKTKCVYCGTTGLMTMEHVLPKSVGGTVVVAACQPCNNKRGMSGSYRPFVAYITANPTVWADAVTTSRHSTDTVIAYIKNYCLMEITLCALMKRI